MQKIDNSRLWPLSLSVCLHLSAPIANAQSQTIPSRIALDNGGLDIGQGYNTVRSTPLNNCVEVHTHSVPGGISAIYTGERSTTLRQLETHLEARGEMSFGFGIYSGSARVSYSSDNSVTSFTDYLVARTYVERQTPVFDSATIRPQFQAMLNDKQGFLDACGNSFVAGIVRGGSFYAVMRFETQNVQARERLQAELKLAVGPFKASGDFTKFQSATQHSTAWNLTVIRQGGRGAIPSLADLNQYATQFVSEMAVDSNAWSLYALPRPYAILGIAATTLPNLSIDARTLRQLASLRDSARQWKADLLFVKANPTRFQKVDSQRLGAWFSQADFAIKALEDEAEKCGVTEGQPCGVPSVSITAMLPLEESIPWLFASICVLPVPGNTSLRDLITLSKGGANNTAAVHHNRGGLRTTDGSIQYVVGGNGEPFKATVQSLDAGWTWEFDHIPRGASKIGNHRGPTMGFYDCDSNIKTVVVEPNGLGGLAFRYR